MEPIRRIGPRTGIPPVPRVEPRKRREEEEPERDRRDAPPPPPRRRPDDEDGERLVDVQA